jgi:hypothetical protein
VCQNCGFCVASGIISTAGQEMKNSEEKKCIQKNSYNSITTYSGRKLPGANLRYTVSKTLLKFGVQRTINALKYEICEVCKYGLN